MKIKNSILLILIFATCSVSKSQEQKNKENTKIPLLQIQQEFLDLRFGMFIHFNLPTYYNEDWIDPNASINVFNPTKLDCKQWARVAKSAGMTYGCLTTKHHSGFCIWDTKTTDYNVMNSPFKRDVVKEYADAFRAEGLKVFLYYSILDTHHDIRKGWIKNENTEFIKAQLTELFTNYGEISGLIIDGWDAFWSRISYEEISFEEIYKHVKSIQPNCLISEHNAGKYPGSALFYTDIKQYEQNAGQLISKETNQIPAQAGLPINKYWFWKTDFPTTPVKSAEFIVNENILPLNNAFCNFILNAAPNRDGLIDENAAIEFAKIGKLWKPEGKISKLPREAKPVIYSNIAKFQKANSSWSNDMMISDFGNDDDFTTAWQSNKVVKQPWIEITFESQRNFNTVSFCEPDKKSNWNNYPKQRIKKYQIQYFSGNNWITIFSGENPDKVQVCRFKTVKASKVRLFIEECEPEVAVAEFCVYNEK